MNNKKIIDLLLEIGVNLADLGFKRPQQLRKDFNEAIKQLEKSPI